MARFFDPTYDPRQDSGSSGSEVSDLRPERAYDTDLRRIEPSQRGVVEPINNKQDRVAKFLRAARSAGKFMQSQMLEDTTLNGRVPRSELSMNGKQLPNLGDRIGQAGGMNRPRKPGASSGTFYGFG